MKKKIEIPSPKDSKKETVTALKNETHEKDAVKKGYNEKNPTQPQGAFAPDAASKET